MSMPRCVVLWLLVSCRPLTEHAIAERLEKFRAAQDNYVSLR
jgi:hypothetical protein